MFTSELLHNLQSDPLTRRQLGDVCAADQIPLTIHSRPRLFIVNTDVSGLPGTHWVLFYFPLNGTVEFFDPAGQAPEKYQARFKAILILNGPSYVHNVSRFQPPGSTLCGEYCLYFAKIRCRGFSYAQTLRRTRCE